MIKIDKNIPIPVKKALGERYTGTPIAKMEVGDSFYWEVRSSGGIKKEGRRYGFVLMIRKENSGFRIWRIE